MYYKLLKEPHAGVNVRTLGQCHDLQGQILGQKHYFDVCDSWI